MYSNKYDKIIGQWTGKTYIILKKLGVGGIGEIYLVQDSSGQLMALKLSTDIISITKEYRFLCKLRDKCYVPKVYDLDDYIKHDKTYHYFTMEYIKGYNLKKAIKQNEMSIKTKLNLICVIIQIIKQINEAGYIYTDLKHENIMIDKENKLVKLIDFGSLVQIGSSVKEFTPMYDRLSWGKGKRVADCSYQIFTLAIFFISLMLNRTLDPQKEKLDPALANLKKKQVPKSVLKLINECLLGQVSDCKILYDEISSASENYCSPDRLKTAINILIAVLALLLTVTIFAFVL